MCIRLCWVHSGATWVSLGSFWCDLGVIGLIRGCWVHSGAPSWLLGSFGVVAPCEFIGGRWIHWGSFGSLGVIGFIGDRWVPLAVHSGAARWSLGSFGVRPGCSKVHSGSVGSFGCVLGIVGFVWCHSGAPFGLSGSLGYAIGVVVLIRHRWVHSGALWGRWFHSRSLGSFVYALPWGSSVLFGAMGLFGCTLGLIGFIRGRWLVGCALGDIGVILWCWVRSCASSGSLAVKHWGLLGSFGCTLGVIMFIWRCLVNSDSP